MDKNTYESPVVSVVGTIADVTQALGTGEDLDADFPRNTPKSQLTFSG